MEAAGKPGSGEALTIEAVLDAEHAEIHGAAAPEIAGLDRVARVQSANFEAGTAALCFSGQERRPGARAGPCVSLRGFGSRAQGIRAEAERCRTRRRSGFLDCAP